MRMTGCLSVRVSVTYTLPKGWNALQNMRGVGTPRAKSNLALNPVKQGLFKHDSRIRSQAYGTEGPVSVEDEAFRLTDGKRRCP